MNEEKKAVSINISWQVILKIIAILAAIYLLFLIKGVLAILFVAFLLSSALEPAVNWLGRRHMPRPIAAAIFYLFFIATLGLIAYLLIPPLAREAIDFSRNAPEYLAKISDQFPLTQGVIDNNDTTSSATDNLLSFGANWQGAAGKIISTLIRIFGGFVSFALIMVLAFYMLVEEGAVNKLVLSLVPKNRQPRVINLFFNIRQGIGRWARGQLLLSLIVFILVYLGLLIIGVKYALILAIFAGIAEFVPYLGPWIAAVPAVILAFSQAPILALLVAILFYVIQWLEGHVIVPQIMGRFIGLNPIVIIAVMLVGFKLASLAGAVLAIPLAMIANVILKDFLEKRSERESE